MWASVAAAAAVKLQLRSTCNMTNQDRRCVFYCSSSVSYHRVKGNSVGSMCSVLSRRKWTAAATSNTVL